jgi:hypothetical protein
MTKQEHAKVPVKAGPRCKDLDARREKILCGNLSLIF